LNLTLCPKEEAILAKTVRQFGEVFLEQPQVLVHRDYHARNLLVLEDKLRTPGVIDFQDAVIGPITYDLASLLKDCYLTWPKDKVKPLLEDFYLALRAEKKHGLSSFEQFYRWYDWTGLQRHVKVLGIFSRLYLRDNKTRYLYDMPRVLAYVLAVTQEYPALSEFHDFMKKRILPAFSTYWESQHISILATPKDTGNYHSLLVQVA
jgi:aminoglycoside/choline kinase family phosphotransferase